jgi:hypothetical protein
MRTIILLLTSILLFSSCQKQPIATITTDKTEYTAGETIHLINTTDNADSYLWTTSDGKTYTTKNLDYTTDIHEHSGIRTFKLEVFSKNKKKTSSAIKTITVKQGILPTDFYKTDTFSYIPTVKSSYLEGGNWVMYAKHGNGYINIYLPGNTPPVADATYSINNNSIISNGQAFIIIRGDVGGEQNLVSESGQLFVTVLSNGTVRAIFNGVSAKYIFNNSIHTISGDITCE